MNNYYKSYLLILASAFLLCNCNPEVDRCVEKLENGINPKPITADIDAWVTDQQNDILEFIGPNGVITKVQLVTNLSDSIDVECPEVIFNKHQYKYEITDTTNITGVELQGRFTAKIRGAGSELFYDINTWIDQLENLSIGGSYFDEVIIQGEIYEDVFLVTEYLRDIDLIVDSIYFQRGTGLIAFEYQNNQLLRQ